MEECKECYQIICRGCGWKPDPDEFLLVTAGKLTTCPLCGWKPGDIEE